MYFSYWIWLFKSIGEKSSEFIETSTKLFAKYTNYWELMFWTDFEQEYELYIDNSMNL